MSYKSLMAAAAGAAIIAATPALSQGRGNGGAAPAGGQPAGAPAPATTNSQGPANASPTGSAHANERSVLSTGSTTTTTRAPDRSDDTVTGSRVPTDTTSKSSKTQTDSTSGSQALEHSQGPANASPNGIAHANEHSVLARGAVSATSPQLQGLNTGLTVNTSTGTTLGAVTQVITGPNNTIRGVVVTSSTGQTYTLAPSTLTVSGGVVTTTTTPTGG